MKRKTYRWNRPALLLSMAAVMVSCGADLPRAVSRDVSQIGSITHPPLTESSGVAASRTQTNVFWTHSDGRKGVLHAMSRTGTPVADFRITGIRVDDWEDLAIDDSGKLYIADTGNNDLKRTEIAVYQVDEPNVSSERSGAAPIKAAWRLRFPQKPFDCEALFVWQNSGYVISKVFNDAKAELYRFSLTNAPKIQTLTKIATLNIDSPVTGAAISPDGRLLGIVAKNGAYVAKIKGNPARAAEVKLHHTKFNDHVEACTFVPEGLLATSETREIYLFTDDDFIPAPKE